MAQAVAVPARSNGLNMLHMTRNKMSLLTYNYIDFTVCCVMLLMQIRYLRKCNVCLSLIIMNLMCNYKSNCPYTVVVIGLVHGVIYLAYRSLIWIWPL